MDSLDTGYPEDLANEEARSFANTTRKAEDRRRQERFEVRLPVRYRYPAVKNSNWVHGLVLNLSETGGAFLVDGAWPHAERVDGGDGFRIEIELDGVPGNGRLHLAGGVVWVDPDGGGAEGIDRIGVKFTDPTDEEIERLRAALAEADS
ncbi:MAG: PilZ domain-containing protein [Planctomycetota bacterium]